MNELGDPASGEILAEGPFGNPDGARANVGNVFVDMGGVAPHLLIRRDDFSARLVVGRKGSGKTFHLRNLEISASTKSDGITFEDTDPLPEWVLRDITSAIDPKRAHFTWQLIWRRAVFLFLGSLCYCTTRTVTASWADQISSPLPAAKFKGKFGAIFECTTTEITPVQFIQKFASRFQAKPGEFARYLQNEQWVEFENLMSAMLRYSPPVYIFIDALDIQGELISRLWYDAQLGLFQLIFELLSGRRFGNKLHIMTTIRDVVYRNVLRGEHASRYVGDAHIRLLSWGVRETEYFLSAKIERLSEDQFSGRYKERGKSVAGWLGFSAVDIPKRGKYEPVLDYILRHTRAVPRDIIIVGNRISREKRRCVSLGSEFGLGHLRKSIEDAARLFANESVGFCASEMLLNESAASQYRNIVRADTDDLQIIRRELERKIRDFVMAIGTEIFSNDILQTALEVIYIDGSIGEFEKETLGYDRIDHVLWRNGLVAYLDVRGGQAHRPRWTYVWYSDTEQAFLPPAHEYGFHPSLIDLYGISEWGPPYCLLTWSCDMVVFLGRILSVRYFLRLPLAEKSRCSGRLPFGGNGVHLGGSPLALIDSRLAWMPQLVATAISDISGDSEIWFNGSPWYPQRII